MIILNLKSSEKCGFYLKQLKGKNEDKSSYSSLASKISNIITFLYVN